MADEKRERRPQRRQAEDDGLIKKLIEVNRVTKVVKGGKNMRFAALVIVGDGKGMFLPPFTTLVTRFTSMSFLISPSSSACLL